MSNQKVLSKTFGIMVILLLCFIFPQKASAQATVPLVSETVAEAVPEAEPIFLYPIDVEEKTENDYGIIIRTYALKPEENPKDIPKGSFEKFGVVYELTDVIKKENRTEDKFIHNETVTINTAGNDMNEILKQLGQSIPYDKDGYSGKLSLILDSVNCEVAGYKTNSYTMNTTREYPNFSSQDTSLVPKTVNEKGVTYSLSNVTFKAQNTNSVDYEEIAQSYIAVASYSAGGSSKNVTGYVTTAEYSGEVTKTLTNEVIYKAHYVSKTPIVEPVPEPIPEPEPTTVPEPVKEPVTDNNIVSVLPIILSILSLLAVCGIGGYLFVKNTYNTIIFNKQGVEYKKAGQLKIDCKAEKPLINLNKITSKSASDEFVIELSKGAMKQLLKDDKEKKEITVIYKDDERLHTIASYATAEKYQFEISFEGKKEADILDDE